MKLFYLAPLFLIATSLGGCAIFQNSNRFENSSLSTPIKLVVVESPMSIETQRLKAILAQGIPPKSPASAEAISQGESHAQQHAMTLMNDALRKQTKLDVLTIQTKENPLASQIQRLGLNTPITQDEADWLRNHLGADALLRYGITDYGLTPKSWRNGYITFEVVSTLAIAGVIAYSGSAAAKAAAGAYIAQEAVEETAEAYAGFWALDVVSRPVRIEAELIQLKPLAKVWETDDTGLSDTRLSRLTKQVSSTERTQQLDQSTDNAIKHVVSNLSDALENLEPDRNNKAAK